MFYDALKNPKIEKGFRHEENDDLASTYSPYLPRHLSNAQQQKDGPNRAKEMQRSLNRAERLKAPSDNTYLNYVKIVDETKVHQLRPFPHTHISGFVMSSLIAFRALRWGWKKDRGERRMLEQARALPT